MTVMQRLRSLYVARPRVQRNKQVNEKQNPKIHRFKLLDKLSETKTQRNRQVRDGKINKQIRGRKK